MVNLIRTMLAALLLLAVSTVYAQDRFTTECENLPPQPDAEFFLDFAEQVHNAKALFCSKKPLEVPDYPDSFLNAPDHLKIVGARDVDLVEIKDALADYLQRNEVPQMQAKNNGRIEMNMRPYQVITDLNVCNAMVAEVETSGNCKKALEEFVAIYSDGQAFYSLYKAVKTVGQLETLEDKWEAFLEHSKSQTIWELAFNGWLYKKSEDASFKRPPSRQWILLHPGIVIESVSEAVDGDETREALSLDVIGYNDWTRDEWYIPSGVSYTLLYSDRKDVKDWGNGISLHFKNKYVLGISEHDGDEGWYVSVDLLDFLRDKKQQFNAYTSQF